MASQPQRIARPRSAAADVVELRAFRQLVLQRQEVDLAALLRERAHGSEDGPVRVLEEVGGVDRPQNAVERVVVDEDGSEDGAFGVRALRQLPIERSIELGDRH